LRKTFGLKAISTPPVGWRVVFGVVGWSIYISYLMKQENILRTRYSRNTEKA